MEASWPWLFRTRTARRLSLSSGQTMSMLWNPSIESACAGRPRVSWAPSSRAGKIIYLWGLRAAVNQPPSAYTLIETAKLNGVNPQAWLSYILDLTAEHKANPIDELLPWHYAQVSA